MEALLRVTETIKSIRETRLSALRSPTEFFDVHRLSRPADTAQAVSRITYNTRYFSGNYTLIFLILGIYALLTSPFLLFSLALVFGGFAAINKFVTEPLHIGDRVITQQTLYTALFVVGIPLLWISSPFWIIFWVIGASGSLILAHAALMEPGIESEYASVQDSV